jgi:hypothetical protein
VTLALDVVAIAGGIFLGRLVARALRRQRRKAALPPERDGSIAASDDPLTGFVCKLGDVVVRRVEGDEAWLAGALVLEEDRPVAALFVAPEAGGERAVLATGPGESGLAWLAPVAKGELALGAEPPPTLERAGTRYERSRRLPVRIRRLGTGAPDVGPSAILGEYVALGVKRLVVLAGSASARAWHGVALAEGDYDVLPSGKSTLDRP